MSVEAMALVLHHSRATGTDKLVLLGIANHDGDGGAWPTVATLARYANTSERSVQRSLGKLTALGEVAVHRNAGGLGNLHTWERPNRYDVLVTCPATCDHTKNHRERKLPTAPAALWTDPVTPTSPGDTHVTGGTTPTSPGEVTPTSPKPSPEPDANKASRSLTGPRASCAECGLDADECIRRAKTSGHAYRPSHSSSSAPARVVAAELEDCLYAYGCRAALHVIACPEHPDFGS